MDYDLTEETLEEGRVALYQLERQLKERNNNNNNNNISNIIDATSVTSSKPSSSSIQERKKLDQKSRGERLSNRESLGLTIEELDDRGLLDGGASLPSYYTSMRQKSRRTMEMQSRTHRLQGRGKETLSKLLNAFLHMVRTLTRKGLDLEEYCSQRDSNKHGTLNRKLFYSILKSLGLPFTSRELQDITNYYCLPSTDNCDYIALLKDARILKKIHNNINNNNNTKEINNPANNNNGNIDIGGYTIVLSEMKRLLLESIQRLNKHPDDVYRMFARWDTQGTSTVTATQFLRVLARLHINLSDADQDYLVELLDINTMGRIDFENLLSYCFYGLNQQDNSNENGFNDTILSPMSGGMGSLTGDGGESLSAVSTESNRSQRSGIDTPTHRRPHTATLSRPYNESLQQQAGYSDRINPIGNNHSDSVNYHRPVTASGRVSSNNQYISNNNNRNIYNNSDVLELPDDVINDDEKYRNNNLDRKYSDANSSGTDNQYEHNFGSPHDMPQIKQNVRSNGWTTTTGSSTSSNDNNIVDNAISPITWREAKDTDINKQYRTPTTPTLSNNISDTSKTDPSEHLVLLANQILSTLRDIIMTRYRRGRSLSEIFQHFDRNNKKYFNAHDFIVATSDLSIETSERVANIAINIIAIDNYDKVSYGEFKVFVLDIDHKLLELNIQEQLSSILEQKGREYALFMNETFYNEEESVNDTLSNSNNTNNASNSGKSSNDNRQNGYVSRNAFVNTLYKIGAKLTSSEVNRLVSRFDSNGNDQCSVTLFVTMIQNSVAWKNAEKVLSYQDEAIEEADYLRKQLYNNNNDNSNEIIINNIAIPKPSEELISMCEYLGIRIISEQNMIWIAADALKAPLPVNWSAKKDKKGRTYFYNHMTNQSKLEHPLDPHFRKLRDKYRQGSIDSDINNNSMLQFSNGYNNNDNYIKDNRNIRTARNNNSNNHQNSHLTNEALNQSLSGPAPPHMEDYASGLRRYSQYSEEHHRSAKEAEQHRNHNYNTQVKSKSSRPSSAIQYSKKQQESNHILPSMSGSSNRPSSGAGATAAHLLGSAPYSRPVSAPNNKKNINTTAKKNNKNILATVGSLGPSDGPDHYLRNVEVYHDTALKLKLASEKVSNTPARIEAIYKSPYSTKVTLPNSMQSDRVGGNNNRYRNNNRNTNNQLVLTASSHSSNSRPTSASRPSIIDRALNHNNTVNNISDKQSKLSEMFEDNIVEKLDNVINKRNY